MALNERIALIIKENHLKQKELAAIIGVTESYISALLAGRNTNLSNSPANVIEEKLGYNAQWVLTGEGPIYKTISKNPDISDIHKRVIFQLEKLPDTQVRAVLAFIEALDKIEACFSPQQNND